MSQALTDVSLTDAIDALAELGFRVPELESRVASANGSRRTSACMRSASSGERRLSSSATARLSAERRDPPS
jgi:hypothetical protein